MLEKWHKLFPNAINMWDKCSFQVGECTWEAALLQDCLSSLIEITACTLELAEVKIYILCMSVKCLRTMVLSEMLHFTLKLLR